MAGPAKEGDIIETLQNQALLVSAEKAQEIHRALTSNGFSIPDGVVIKEPEKKVKVIEIPPLENLRNGAALVTSAQYDQIHQEIKKDNETRRT